MMHSKALWRAALVLALSSCAAPASDEDLSSDDSAVKMSKKKDVDQADRDAKIEQALVGIRKVAHEHDLQNGWLVAGIAKVETQLTHCYDFAQFKACPSATTDARGKVSYVTSPDCDKRPVVVGASDKGGCSEGGIGLFQLDSGNQTKTISSWKLDGLDILSVDGNVRAAMNILETKIRSAIQAHHVTVTNDRDLDRGLDPDAWLRTIKAPNRDDKDYETYLGILANGYNGWDWDAPGWAKQKTKYHDGIIAVLAMHDAAWWKS